MKPITTIRRDEVLRYLGYSGQPLSDDLLGELSECESLVLSRARPAYVFRVFEFAETKDGIALSGSTLVLGGEDIKAHLKGCKKLVLFAATLSGESVRLIDAAAVKSVSRALLMDAAADALIEQVCDAAEAEIRAEMPETHATWRFSPGYGDFPVSLQNEILTVLDAQRRIGLCATDSQLLTPRKSVTAVIGLSDEELPRKQRGCETCAAKKTCIYRKRGDRCDHN